MERKQAFTGRRRNLRNRWSVKAGDVAARVLITIGGIGTIIAVSGVFLVLFGQVLPLFLPAQLEEPVRFDAPWQDEPLQVAVDEYQLLGWAFLPDGRLRVFRLDTGETLSTKQLLDGEAKLTAAAFGRDRHSVALGFADGTVRQGTIAFRTTFPPDRELSPAERALEPGEMLSRAGGVLQRSPQGELRRQEVFVELGDPLPVASAPVTLIDRVSLDRGPLLMVCAADGTLVLNSIRERENLLTGEITQKATRVDLPFEPRVGQTPAHLLLSGLGDSAYVIWKDGFLRRYGIRNLSDVRVAEELNLLDRDEMEVTAATLLLGEGTLLVGDTAGRTRAWFRVRPEGSKSADGSELVVAHELPGTGAAVTALAHAPRSRMAAVGYADGQMRVIYVPTSDLLAEATVAQQAAVRRLIVAPKDNALYAAAEGKLWRADFDPRHPEASLTALFRPVWYEGYAEPDHVWQSGGGTESLEPKLGMWPLVSGTLKATFYSMLFGAPLALLAAIYTSEFLHSRTRAKIKPTIELMASLPSVVLGFLAALVFAPIIERILPTALTTFITVPLAFLIGAYLWQLVPYNWALRLQRWRLLLIALLLPLGLLAAYLLGPLVERGLFAGDIMAWLDGQAAPPGSGWRQLIFGMGGWLMLLLPLYGVGMAVFMGATVNPWLRRRSYDWSRRRLALVTLVKFLLAALLTFGLAWLTGFLLSLVGFDPRGSYVDTYDQRNALVVGFVMGFAIIPIIFTIADDALSTVPQHLRSGSLGAGATPWQTAVRIVIPTAMSGLFSAVMIGLGRAVGETMIVLMAAGNTPIREWNIFNGFRTLSATIAVELPEAARGSTHFRTLFLAALVLFMLTFAVNTVAEIVRLRFRRRAYQL